MTPQPTVGEIVAAAEVDTSRDQLQSQQRKRVYMVLYQTHVPKLNGQVWWAGQKPAARSVPPLRRPQLSARWTTSPTGRLEGSEMAIEKRGQALSESI